jgi:tripartite-type tricarboxylate transporter receptor subunit TctC
MGHGRFDDKETSMRMTWTSRWAGVLLAAFAAQAVAQEPFPTKPVRLIVPYASGNVTDVVGREVARGLGQRWGQSVVVVNMAGAGGAIGAASGARAAPDGYSLTLLAMSALAITPRLTKGGVAYDPIRDFSPIGMLAVPYAFLAVNSKVPVRTVQELVTYARSKPGEPMFYMNPGIGTLSHLNMELLRRALDFPTQGVVYKGSGEGMTDLLAGRLQLTIDPLSVTMPHLQSGALRPLAYTGPARHPAFPNVPTLKEIAPQSGVSPVWLGLLGPKGMPAALVDKIAKDLQATLASPEFASHMPAGLVVSPTTPEELAAQIRRDYDQFGRLLTELDIKPE